SSPFCSALQAASPARAASKIPVCHSGAISFGAVGSGCAIAGAFMVEMLRVGRSRVPEESKTAAEVTAVLVKPEKSCPLYQRGEVGGCDGCVEDGGFEDGVVVPFPMSLGGGGLLGTVVVFPAGVVLLPGVQGVAAVADVPLGRDGVAEATV